MAPAATASALIIRLNRIQRDLIPVQATVAGWNGNQSPGEETVSSKRLKSLQVKFEETQDAFDQVATADESLAHEPQFTTIANDLVHVMVAIENALDARNRAKGHNQTFKFEKLKLPVFSGDFSDWQEFSDLYRAAVHNDPTKSGAAKMIHLRDALKGDAATIISNTPATDAGYDEAWQKVEARYSNQRELVFAHLKRFYKLQRQPDTSSGLRKVCDTVNELVRSVTQLNIQVNHWDVILIFLALKKLDQETKKQWLLTQGNTLPQLSNLLEYLEKRAAALTESPNPSTKGQTQKPISSTSSHHTTAKGKGKSPSSCIHCNEAHYILSCPTFKGLHINDKLKFVAERKLCPRCLSTKHQYVKDCPSKHMCRTCGKEHSTLLHFEKRSTTSGGFSTPSTPPPVNSSTSTDNSEQVLGAHTTAASHTKQVALLPTVMVKVRDSLGQVQLCRVFLDEGSEANFISEHAVSRFGLKRLDSCVEIDGIGEASAGTSRGFVSLKINSTLSSFKIQVNAHILPKLTGLLPRRKCTSDFRHLNGLPLADPNFFSPAAIDLMIGTITRSQILLPGLIRGAPGTPLAQNSEFGWFLTGSAQACTSFNQARHSNFHVSVHHSTCTTDEPCLESSLRRFWELEEPSSTPLHTTSEDQLCESNFLSTFSRDTDGRFEVQLPFAPGTGTLGNSRLKAISCFKSLEGQIRKDSKLKTAYHSQIEDYMSKGWVTAVPPSEIHSSNVPVTTVSGEQVSLPPYYIPHHVVVKPDSKTTKYRIVFNASAKTVTGNSLNSLLLPGPKIQTDLHPLLTRFRTHPIALGADIVKFYNQVKLFPPHWHFQRFIWRKEPTDPFCDFQFTRVIFGVTSAPFLAIRSLRQLGEEFKEEFPLAYSAIQNDFLVDNLLSGAQTLEEAMEVKSQISNVLTKGNFPLQKWMSNHPEVLNSIHPSERETYSLNIQDDESVKTIGLFYHPASDTFGVNITICLPIPSTTKREVLSHTARVFDPLQWLAPVTITPKILLQSLWKEKLGWDEPIPRPLFLKWEKYCQELTLLREFRIPRCLTFSSFPKGEITYDLIGFCDASNHAYAAVVYLRSKSRDKIQVQLIECKSKVAPVQGETTPKLELCGAVLLTKLINALSTTLSSTKININSAIGYTDSTGVLGQLFSKEKQPVFVANRVRKIRNSPALIHWYHVPGEDNPADLPSRGISAQNLLQNRLWLKGPDFLITGDLPPQPYQQSVASFSVTISPGETFVNSHLTHLINSKHPFSKMKRLIGWWIRFLYNSNKKNVPVYGPLTTQELTKALNPMVKCIQSRCFAIEIEQSSSGETVKGQFRFLSPFLDKDGILRVGGRLQNSTLPFQSRHPILLPRCHSRPTTPEEKSFRNFTSKITKEIHIQNLHAAPKLLHSLIRSEFWIVRGQNLCSKVYHHCISCFRQHRQPLTQIMAPLPSARVIPDFPFVKVGVDYAGPFTIAVTPGRNPRLIKAWVCVFVCMSTKAAHLEFSSSLSTPAFISAFQRFCAVRNSPSDIYCDGGTNFLGARNDMEDLQKLISSDDHRKKVALFLTGEKVNFHFNPPQGPHHGGLWEAAVKSMKLHLHRVMQNHHLSIEEFLTLLARTSAALNSRPLTPLSNHPDDFAVLTPFHFLTLRGPKEIAEEDWTTMKSHRSRWQLVQQMTQHLFRRWSRDYLQHLQKRGKWLDPQPNLTKGTLVLLHDADSPLGPQRWNLGRILEVFPGKDGKVRSCDVRLPIARPEDLNPKKGTKPNWKFKVFRRPITQLSPLPLDEDVTAAFVTLS